MGSETILPCPYCGGVAKFYASSAHRYHGRDYGPIYECQPCDAMVGCHKGTTTPLGTLANAALRESRKAAHAAFDPVWRNSRRMSRGRAYAKLAKWMKLTRDECHIGMFNAEQCAKVVSIVEKWAEIARQCQSPSRG